MLNGSPGLSLSRPGSPNGHSQSPIGGGSLPRGNNRRSAARGNSNASIPGIPGMGGYQGNPLAPGAMHSHCHHGNTNTGTASKGGSLMPSPPPASLNYIVSATGSPLSFSETNMDWTKLNIFRTRLCDRLTQTRTCHMANRCLFSHDIAWPRRTPFLPRATSLTLRYIPVWCPRLHWPPLVGYCDSMGKISWTSADANWEIHNKGHKRCTRGENCPFVHNMEELLFHPEVYKTRSCCLANDDVSEDHKSTSGCVALCPWYFCPFAHDLIELRNLHCARQAWHLPPQIVDDQFVARTQDFNDLELRIIDFVRKSQSGSLDLYASAESPLAPVWWRRMPPVIRPVPNSSLEKLVPSVDHRQLDFDDLLYVMVLASFLSLVLYPVENFYVPTLLSLQCAVVQSQVGVHGELDCATLLEKQHQKIEELEQIEHAALGFQSGRGDGARPAPNSASSTQHMTPTNNKATAAATPSPSFSTGVPVSAVTSPSSAAAGGMCNRQSLSFADSLTSILGANSNTNSAAPASVSPAGRSRRGRRSTVSPGSPHESTTPQEGSHTKALGSPTAGSRAAVGDCDHSNSNSRQIYRPDSASSERLDQPDSGGNSFSYPSLGLGEGEGYASLMRGNGGTTSSPPSAQTPTRSRQSTQSNSPSAGGSQRGLQSQAIFQKGAFMPEAQAADVDLLNAVAASGMRDYNTQLSSQLSAQLGTHLGGSQMGTQMGTQMGSQMGTSAYQPGTALVSSGSMGSSLLDSALGSHGNLVAISPQAAAEAAMPVALSNALAQGLDSVDYEATGMNGPNGVVGNASDAAALMLLAAVQPHTDAVESRQVDVGLRNLEGRRNTERLGNAEGLRTGDIPQNPALQNLMNLLALPPSDLSVLLAFITSDEGTAAAAAWNSSKQQPDGTDDLVGGPSTQAQAGQAGQAGQDQAQAGQAGQAGQVQGGQASHGCSEAASEERVLENKASAVGNSASN